MTIYLWKKQKFSLRVHMPNPVCHCGTAAELLFSTGFPWSSKLNLAAQKVLTVNGSNYLPSHPPTHMQKTTMSKVIHIF